MAAAKPAHESCLRGSTLGYGRPGFVFAPDHWRLVRKTPGVADPHPGRSQPAVLQPIEWQGAGINDLQVQYQAKYGPGNYVPLVVFTYWGFRLMVAAGFTMLALAGYALYHVMRNKVGPHIRWLWIFVFAIALPYIANTSGWVLTELGRQPFIVYGLLKTEDAISPGLTTGMVLFSLIGFALIYAALMGADIFLLARSAKAGPDPVARS